MEYVAVFLFSVAAFSLMGGALHFSRYKRRGRACCRGSLHSRLSTESTDTEN